MATLTGQSIASSYEQLLHVDTDGGGAGTTLVPIKDGDNGTLFATQLSTTTLCIDNPVTSSASQGGILRLQSDDGAVMASGHRLGVIEFGGAEDTSSTITTGARIEALTDATWSASENGADLLFYTTDGNASQTEAMRITAEGYIGIGTSTPYANLTVQGVTGGSAVMYLLNYDSDTSGENGAIRFGNRGVDGETASITSDADGATDAGNLNFNTEATGGAIATRMTIDSNSRISLGNNDSGGDTSNTIFGYLAGDKIASGGLRNTLIGKQTGNQTTYGITTGDDNTAIGSSALGASAGADITGSNNTAVGSQALLELEGAAASNTAIGMNALKILTTGTDNTAVGVGAGDAITDTTNCTLVGKNAGGGINDTDANGTTAIGHSALAALTDGAANMAIGYQAMLEHTTGNANIAIGFDAMKSTNAGVNSLNSSSNVMIGASAGSGTWTDLSSNSNVAIGKDVMSGNLEGVDDCIIIGNAAGTGALTADADGSVFIGNAAGVGNTSGRYNTFVGRNSGNENGIGDSNVALGYNSFADSLATLQNDNNVAIGYNSMGGTWVTAASSNNIAIGKSALAGAMNAAGSNVAIGTEALTANVSGSNNIAIGYQALDELTNSSDNVAIGTGALNACDAGEGGNVSIGYGSGGLIDHANSDNNVILGFNAGIGGAAAMIGCIAIGKGAMTSTTTNAQTGTVAIGQDALTTLTSGAENIAIGFECMDAVDDGAENIAIGYQAMSGETSAKQSLAIGSEALKIANTTSSGTVGNVAIGHNCGIAVTTGIRNTITGAWSMQSNETGGYNTGFGYGALSAVTASNNTALGNAAGNNISSGTYNLCLGGNVTTDVAGQHNQTVIGSQGVFKFLSKSYVCDFCKNDDGDTASSESVPLKIPAYSIIKSISVIVTQLSDLSEYDVSLVHSSTTGAVSDDAAPAGTPIELLGAGASDTMSGSSTSAVDINLAEAGEDGIVKQTYYNDFGGDGLSVGTADRYIHVVNADGNGDSNPSTDGYIAVLVEYIGQD